jgi:hypothetical protein
MLALLGVPLVQSFNPAMNDPEAPPISFIGRVKSQLFDFFGMPVMYKLVIGKFVDVFKRNGIERSAIVCDYQQFLYLNELI